MNIPVSILTLSPTTKTILVATLFGVAAYLVSRKKYRLPPGPMALPIVGNILSFRKVEVYEKLAEWKKIYGPAITVYFGSTRCVTLNDTETILEAIVKKQADFADRKNTPLIDAISHGGKDIIFAGYSPTWRRHRKLASKALRYYLSGNQLEVNVMASVENVVNLLKKQKEPIDPHQYNASVAFNILVCVCFGEEQRKNEVFFKNMLESFDEFITSFGNGPLEDIIPILRIFPNSSTKKILRASDKVFEIITSIVDSRIKTFSEDNIRDFTDCLLLAQKTAQQEGDVTVLSEITNRHICHTVSDIFTAGIDTSRFTLNWSMLYLATHPEVQSKVHEEVDRVVGRTGLLLLSHRSKLPYTEAVLHEVMRLSSVVPLSIPHATTCDTKIGDYDVPKGTMVLLNLWAMHHDPDKWEDAEAFRPERFLDKDGALAAKPDSWLPFSAGRRVCLGESVAKPELLLILAAYMRTFKISLPAGEKPDLEPMKGGFTRIPKPFKLLFEERA